MANELAARERRGFPVGLTLATVVSLVILIGLGTWQLQRLAWKEQVLARIAALQSAPARPAAEVLASGARSADLDFTRVTADCPGLATAPFLELYAVRDGQAGVRLISTCRLAAPPYASILVDRGFVADTVSARPPVDATATAPTPRSSKTVDARRAEARSSTCTPVSVLASAALGLITSIRRSNSFDSGTGGDGSRMIFVSLSRSRRAAVSTDASDDSSCMSTTFAAVISGAAARISSTER